MNFIYENIQRESGVDHLAKYFDYAFKVRDWDSSVPDEGVFIGSIAGCKWMQDKRPNVKVWSTFGHYKCSRYYPHIQELLFNDKYAFIPFQDLARRKWDIFGWLGEQAMVFIRPDSGEKDTPAQLVDIQDIDQFVADYDYEGLAVVSTPKDSIGEWRFVVSPDKIHTVSLYKYQGLLSMLPAAPPEAYALVEEVLKKGYYPDDLFCVDVVQGMDKKFYVMELTSFSSAGLYANDPRVLAKLINERQ